MCVLTVLLSADLVDFQLSESNSALHDTMGSQTASVKGRRHCLLFPDFIRFKKFIYDSIKACFYDLTFTNFFIDSFTLFILFILIYE